jgi:release factor glutamine methyltransferase
VPDVLDPRPPAIDDRSSIVDHRPSTIDDLLAEAVGRLAAARVPEPRREALRLWADRSGTAPGEAYLARATTVSAAMAQDYLALVDRRAAGEPLAYVTGKAGFRRLVLAVDRRVLIPRPETEGLVDLVLRHGGRGTMADIGTGSGCIALSLRLEADAGVVLAVDQCPGALAVAAANMTALALPVSVLRGDLTTALAPGSLDVLVSNPPYIARHEYLALEPGVREWEPRQALESGVDGQDATRRLLDDGRRVLRAGGLLVLELDASRAEGAGRAAGHLGWDHVQVQADLFGRARYLVARRRSDP